VASPIVAARAFTRCSKPDSYESVRPVTAHNYSNTFAGPFCLPSKQFFVAVPHLVVARNFVFFAVPAFSLQGFDPGIVQRAQSGCDKSCFFASGCSGFLQ
jgi:hypothetical protein